jgi:hypothetical protein
LLGLVPLFIIAFRHWGIEVAETDLVDFINAVATVIASVMVALGLARKLGNLFRK